MADEKKIDIDTKVEKKLAEKHEAEFPAMLGGYPYLVTKSQFDEYLKRLAEVEKLRGDLTPDDARFKMDYQNARRDFNEWVATTLKSA
jgi:hypothetical protein